MKQVNFFFSLVVIILLFSISLVILAWNNYMFVIVDYVSLPFLTIDRVFTIDNAIYARGVVGCSYGMGSAFCEEGKEIFYVSNDLGGSWLATQMLPSEAANYLKQLVESTKVLCYSDDNSVCYRIIKGEERVMFSLDGGSTWRTTWKIPVGRKFYMQRYSDFPYLGVTPDTAPYDLALFDGNEGRAVIVAMGNQGVLIRNNNSDWNRVAVSSDFPLAAPVPYRADSIEELMGNLSKEWKTSAFLSILYFFVHTIFGWVNLHSCLGKKFRYIAVFFYAPFIVFCVSCYYLMDLARRDYIRFWMVVKGEWIDYEPQYLFLLPFLGLILTWGLFIIFTPRRVIGLLASFVPLISTLTLFVGALLPLVLWGVGIVPIYTIALIFSFAITIFIVFYSFRLQKRIAKRATLKIGEKILLNKVAS